MRRGTAGIDAQGAGGRVSEKIEIFQGVVDIAEGRLDARIEPLAGFGQGHAAGGAIEQPHPQPLLKRSQGVAQGRG
ncbi:hypothetical protein D3C81_1644650 [compost metagenome]